MSLNAVHNWVDKLSQGRSKVEDDARSGRHVEIETEATMQRVEELIRADRKITMGIIATALRGSHGLSYSIMHDRMQGEMCLTGLLLGRNHGCITTNSNQSELQCNGNIPVHLQLKSLILRHQLGSLCLPCFGLLRKNC
jgi:hypothetical protein